MCLLTCFLPDVQPDIDTLLKGADHNPDGHGWALIADGARILTGRSMDPDVAVEEFRVARLAHPEGYALFHSRIGTQGPTNLANCHPFPTGPSARADAPLTFMAHNGMLPVQVPKGDERSDTRYFADKLMPQWFFHLDAKKTRRRFESWLGSFNKIAVLTVDPRYSKQFYLFNEYQGTWKNGIWYSNQNHCWSFPKYDRYPWSAYDAARSAGAGVKHWWDDVADDAGNVTMGPKGIWVAGGREGATWYPSESATARSLDGRKWEFECGVCYTAHSISRIDSVCGWCHHCDICGEHEEQCRCEPATPCTVCGDDVRACPCPATLDAGPSDSELFDEYMAEVAAGRVEPLDAV